jgi:hypothetical protein
MSCESKQWAPSRMHGPKLYRYVIHVYRHARRQAEEFMGPHAGRLLAAEFEARRREDQSRAMLADRGVKTLAGV